MKDITYVRKTLHCFPLCSPFHLRSSPSFLLAWSSLGLGGKNQDSFPWTAQLLVIKTLTWKSSSSPEFQEEIEIPVRNRNSSKKIRCLLTFAFQTCPFSHLMVRPLTQVVLHRPVISVSRTRGAVKKTVGINSSQRKEKAWLHHLQALWKWLLLLKGWRRVGKPSMQNLPQKSLIPSEILYLIYWPNERKIRLGGQRWEQTKGMHVNIFKISKSFVKII